MPLPTPLLALPPVQVSTLERADWLFQFDVLRQIHIDKIYQKMGNYQHLDIAVFNVVYTEQHPYQKGKYQLAVTAEFVMQR